uniref:Angiotensin-converting enzyme n=1 Tax=Clastoptera arizonana TaxID=38151 RepID=A0A1B6CJL2_9HEMI
MKVLYLVAVVTLLIGTVTADDEDKARDLLNKLNQDLEKFLNNYLTLLWNYEVDINDDNLNKLLENGDPVFEFDDGDLPWATFTDADVARQSKLYGMTKVSNTQPLNATDDLDDTIMEMVECVFNLTICDYQDKTICNYTLDEDLEDIFAESKSADELSYYWKSLTDQIGQQVKPFFKIYVELANVAPKLDGYASKAEESLAEFEQPPEDVELLLKDAWYAMKPLYSELQAYFRFKLNEQFGDNIITKSGPIPIQLSGSLQGSDFWNLNNKFKPYPGVKKIHVDDFLSVKNLSSLETFQLVEKTFKSLNMKPMTESFWKNSLIEEPSDREAACDSSSWDMYEKDDFRIQHCTDKSYHSLLEVYSLMTEIEYYMYYQDKPAIYKASPLTGFDDGLVGAVRRSIRSLKQLKKSGIIDTPVTVNSQQYDINYLFEIASIFLPYMSYAYSLENWKRDVFRGKIVPEKYNEAFWAIRLAESGIAPPEPRSENTLDAATELSVLEDSSLTGDFVSSILQFQIYRDLCIASGEFDPSNPTKNPLHKCDFTSSPKAGKILGSMMEIGRAKPWYEILKVGTGNNKLDGSALVDFLAPLQDWLKEENKKNGATPGW